MTRILIILLSVVVLAQTLQKTWIVASWNLNRDYIAANLCENRMDKTSKCSGCCYLKKQLKEEDQKEQNTPASEKDKFEFVCSLFLHHISVRSFSTTLSSAFPTLWLCGKPNHIGYAIFHPPSLAG